MLRFLLALLFLGALWLGYERLVAPSAQASGPLDDNAAATAVGANEELAPQPPPALTASPETPSAPPSALSAPATRTPVKSDPVVDTMVVGVVEGNPQAYARAFDVLIGLRGGERSRLAGALAARSMRAGPDERVQLLGRSNAFLKCDEGREIAAEVVRSSRSQPADEAVVTLTALLQACMRGSLEKSDMAARKLVDQAYSALQIPLRRTVLNPAHTAKARSHKVASGESLDRIARRFRGEGIAVESGTVAAFNRIHDPRRLQAGQVLKVPIEPIRTVIAKDSFLMAIYVGDVIFRLYWIGHGANHKTPEATFAIGAKLEHPDWYAPDGTVKPYGHPDNVLGEYFVKFVHESFTGFGAHGTSEPESIGTMASAGCIRMLDADIADFFKIVPRGSKVQIQAIP